LDVTVVLCANTDVHYYSGTLKPNKYSIAAMSILPRADIAFVEGGTPGLIQGKGIVQIDNRHLGIFNADTNVPPNVPVDLKYDLLKVDTAISIDADRSNGDPSPPYVGRILIVTQKDPHQIKVIASNTLAGNPFIGYVNSGNLNKTWTAVDIMGNGNFWAVLRDATGGTPVYTLRRFTFLQYVNPGDPTYAEDLGSMLNITSIVGTQNDIFDIAINDKSGLLYLFEAGASGRGSVHMFTIPPGLPAVYVTSFNNIFSQALDYSMPGVTGFTGFAMYGDIDIDHMESATEPCRILVYARLADHTARLRRYDETFTLLDVEPYTTAATSFAINCDPSQSTRNLIMPMTDTLQWWQSPAAW
jgi:hypothetical protein